MSEPHAARCSSSRRRRHHHCRPTSHPSCITPPSCHSRHSLFSILLCVLSMRLKCSVRATCGVRHAHGAKRPGAGLCSRAHGDPHHQTVCRVRLSSKSIKYFVLGSNQRPTACKAGALPPRQRSMCTGGSETAACTGLYRQWRLALGGGWGEPPDSPLCLVSQACARQGPGGGQ